MLVISSSYISPPFHDIISKCVSFHDDVIKWKKFLRYWPFVRGIHRSPVNSPHKGQWHGALMFSLICVWINGWVNHHEAGDMRRYRAHYDGTVMWLCIIVVVLSLNTCFANWHECSMHGAHYEVNHYLSKMYLVIKVNKTLPWIRRYRST